jgi:hypothetical protein
MVTMAVQLLRQDDGREPVDQFRWGEGQHTSAIGQQLRGLTDLPLLVSQLNTLNRLGRAD